MELTFLRHGGALMIGPVPAAFWLCQSPDRRATGHAGVLEIVPIPLGHSRSDKERRTELAEELRGAEPMMRLRPTDRRVVENSGVAARMWIGSMASGLPVAAFIGVMIPQNDAMSTLLAKELEELAVASTGVDDSLSTISIHVDEALR